MVKPHMAVQQERFDGKWKDLDRLPFEVSGGLDRGVRRDHHRPAMNKAAVQALVVLTDPILFSQRKRTVDLANRDRLPAMYFFKGYAEEGGLMSYGPSDTDLFRRTAAYVDRILKGTKPGDLPIEQPTKFELFINLRAANMIGVTIPESFLLRADKVIE